MLKRSRVSLIVPYMHQFVPGCPKTRGLLYKQSNLNRYHRITAKNPTQRTWRDDSQYMMLMMPEVTFFGASTIGLGFTALYLMGQCFPSSKNGNGNDWQGGNLNDQEVYQRNAEMTEVINRHRTVIRQIREEIGAAPDVLRPQKDSSQNWTMSKVL